MVFIPQIEVAEPGEFDLFSVFQSTTDLFEKQLDQFFGIPLAKPKLIKQIF
ncbi:hypothetical protein UUU_22840 [Klebsiella pneumoniae subsp. pneumoniae DSM 30104 = JCM 1662 = NBRC 14940]|nr:hypothetical protein UUU_22840 [Klebsiella pneumoniae subsp. pneumoniae DSM 30104 = JCM 1662 = NBRC 14940]